MLCYFVVFTLQAVFRSSCIGSLVLIFCLMKGRLLTIRQCHFFRELSALQPVSTPLVTAAEVCVEIVKNIGVMSATGNTLQARAVSPFQSNIVLCVVCLVAISFLSLNYKKFIVQMAALQQRFVRNCRTFTPSAPPAALIYRIVLTTSLPSFFANVFSDPPPSPATTEKSGKGR